MADDEAPPAYSEVNPQQSYAQPDPQPQSYEQPVVYQQPPPDQPYYDGQAVQAQPVYYEQQPPPQQVQPPPQQQQPVYYVQQPQPVDGSMDAATAVPPPDSGVGQEEGYGVSDYGTRLDVKDKPLFAFSEWRDKIWAAVWIIHLFAMLIVLFGFFGSSDVGAPSASDGYLIVFVCGLIGTVLGYVWTRILRRWAGIIIKFMMWANLVMMIISTIITFAAGLIVNGIFLLIFTALFALYMWRVWHRIPFAEAMVMIATDIMKLYPGIIWVALAMLVLQVLWVLVWGGIVSILLASSDIAASYVVYFFLLISLYWNLETFKNICHTTVCGVAAAWFFSPYPQQPVTGSLKRASTTSLGSVALGSLLVAIIQATRAILRQMARDGRCNACLVCIIDCLMGCLERWIRFFNKYAFAHVAIYGQTYIESGKQTWDLLRAKGIDAWVNDDLVGFALFCGSVIGGFICAAVAGLMVMVNDRLDNNLATAYAFLGFFIGFYLCWTVLYTIASCVVSVFVCYAEDPAVMETNRPTEYHKLNAARAGISGAEFDQQQQQEQQQAPQQYGGV